MRFRSIVVALDESDEHRRVLQGAADVAARLSADLQGVFVEDRDLLRLAELSYVREVHHTGVHATPDAAVMRRALRVRADTARRSLVQVAEQHRLQWSFRVAQGSVASELIAAVGHTDLLVVGRKRRAAYRRPPLGVAARRVAAHAPAAILIPGRGDRDGPLVVSFDGTAASRHALAAAATLATESGVVVLAVDPGPGALTRAAEAAACAFRTGHPVEVRACRPEDFAAAANLVQPSLLVYGGDCGPELERVVGHLCDATEAPILLIRSTLELPGDPAPEG